MTVKRYKVISNNELALMLAEVNQLLDDGWELYGDYLFKDGYHFQAVVKRG